ncbi:unnamed protein product [Sphenostylis stenocarpa]|uniref:SHSP domain-containing protein n=1 Tax=Sphenostylis stenocarpa TaxID=92480 RepID=A0AA86S6V6_9FABA|nr:unnamed protein product [Sphenostylis stenocarpa]
MASARDTTRVGVGTRARTPVVERIVPNSGWTQDSAGHYLLVDLPEFRKEEVKLQVDSYGRIVVMGERKINEWKQDYFRLTFPAPVDADMDRIAGKFDGGILYVTIPKQVTQHSKENKIRKAESGKVESVEESGSHRHGNGEVERAEENDSHRCGNGKVERAEENDNRRHGNGKVEIAEENDSHRHENGKVERAEESDSHASNDHEGRRDPSHDKHTEQEVKRNENKYIAEFPEQVIRKWEQESMLRGAVEVLRKNKGIVVTAVIAFSLGLFVSQKLNNTAS